MNDTPAKKNESPAAPPAPPVTLIPDLFPGMTEAEALRALRGRGKDPAQQAVIQMIRLAREDALDAGTAMTLNERQSGFFAGCAHILRELERSLRTAHAQPLE